MDRLPVEDLVQVFVLHLEGDVVRREDFLLEVIRQAVVLGGESGAGIEISFRFQDLLPSATTSSPVRFRP